MVKYPASFQGIVQALADLIGTISGSSGTGGASAANQVTQTEKLDTLIAQTDSIKTYLAGLPTNQSDPTDWLSVRLTNGTSFYSATGGGGGGGGTEYTEGDSVGAIVGHAILWEDTGDVLCSVSATKPLPVGGNVNASLTGGVVGISGTVNTNASLTGGSVGINGTINASLVGGQSTIVGNVDVTPTTPVAGDYLPVRLTDGSNFYLASGGGGGSSNQQYTEGNISATITGTALMWEDSDTLRAVGKDYPLPISDNNGSLTIDGTVNIGNSLTITSITNPVSLSGGSVTISNTPNVIVNSGIITTVQTIDTLKGGIITRVDTLAGGRITQVDTLLGGIITRVDSLAGFIDVTPTSPTANDYLPVRFTNGSSFFTPPTYYAEGSTQATITGTAILWEDASDVVRAVSIAKPLPTKIVGSSLTVSITTGNTTSSAFSIAGQNCVILMPPTTTTRTVKLQILGSDGTTWIDAVTQTTTTSYSFIGSGKIAEQISGATGAGKNNFRLALDSSWSSNLDFKIEAVGLVN